MHLDQNYFKFLQNRLKLLRDGSTKQQVFTNTMFTTKAQIVDSMNGFRKTSKYCTWYSHRIIISCPNIFFRILSTKENINDTHFGKGEKVSSLDLLLEQSDRKITRNQKRKHDEINHVQKVYQLLTVLLSFLKQVG